MKKFKTKTLYAGKAWLNDKHMEALEAGDEVQIHYQDKKMTITKDDVPTLRANKSTESFTCRFRGTKYWLWGIDWKPDVDKQQALFV